MFTLRGVQWLGLIVAVGIGLFSLWRRRAGAFRRLDLLVGLGFAVTLAILSIWPGTADLLRGALQAYNRFNVAVFVAILILFGLYFALLGRVNSLSQSVNELVRALAKADFRRSHALPPREDRVLSIVIPAYNEERAIRGVLTRLPAEVQGLQVEPIIVVDGASDDTEVVARQAGYLVVSHAMNRGVAAAIRTGLEIARYRGAEVVVTMDADGQHCPEEIDRLVQPILEDKADFVLGSRILGYYEERGSIRHAGITFFSWLLSLLLGQRITDCSNGFRAIRASVLARMELHEDRIAPEMLIEAKRKGLRIVEVPVTVLRRAEGESKMPRHIRYPLGFLRTIIRVWLR